MGDVTTTLLDGKARVAENVFGWNRKAVALGIHECQSGIACLNDLNDLSARGKPRTEERHPEMLADIQAIMEPHSESQSSLRTTLLYSRMTASAVREALAQKGWAQPELPSERTLTEVGQRPRMQCQFLLRMTAFADLTGLSVRLVYYPPYHSKYNAIERYWAGLEKSWNGYLLSTVETVIRCAGSFCWKGIRTVACLLDAVYDKGIKLCRLAKRVLEQRLQRSTKLHWWDITIHTQTVPL
jgi:transposase